MAKVRVRNTNELIEGEDNVRSFLDKQGVLYEHWNPSKLPERLQENFDLSTDDKAEILSTFDAEIRDLAGRRGYKTWDIVVLSESTPDIEVLLKKFEQIHTHTEDEVRAITAGEGIFIIRGDEATGYFDVILTAGDVISVPEGSVHFFTLTESKKVVAVRLFIETEGWIAHPYEDPAFVK